MTEPKVITVKRYVCPFCQRGGSTRKAAAGHIARCWHNPAVRACLTCAYHVVEKGDPEVGYPGAEYCDIKVASLATGLKVGCASWDPDPDLDGAS